MTVYYIVMYYNIWYKPCTPGTVLMTTEAKVPKLFTRVLYYSYRALSLIKHTTLNQQMHSY
jgi:hypothetical protein